MRISTDKVYNRQTGGAIIMNSNFKKYSKWFRFLEYLFFPISTLSLIAWGTNLWSVLISLIDFCYMTTYIVTFFTETLIHVIRKNS